MSKFEKENKRPQNYPKEITTEDIIFLYIAGGEYEMGDVFEDGELDELPVHTVKVDSFYMSKYAITFDQYDAFCEETNRDKPTDHDWGRGNLPVINVNWNDATAYCEWVSEKSGKTVRLPTEAEWEYAAREGGKKVRFGNGKDLADASEINFDAVPRYQTEYSMIGTFRRKTIPVDSFASNALGLYNMSGNAWEWCSDWFDEDYYQNSATDNPKGPGPGIQKVIRGGSWFFKPYIVRASFRGTLSPRHKNMNTGFRCIQEI